jgi:hypothetical protein
MYGIFSSIYHYFRPSSIVNSSTNINISSSIVPPKTKEKVFVRYDTDCVYTPLHIFSIYPYRDLNITYIRKPNFFDEHTFSK